MWSPLSSSLNGRHDLRRSQTHGRRQIQHARAQRFHAVRDHPRGRRIHQVNYVVNLARQLVDVFAIEWRHERLVQLPQDVVRDRVANVLEVLDLVGSDRGVIEMLQHLDHGDRRPPPRFPPAG